MPGSLICFVSRVEIISDARAESPVISLNGNSRNNHGAGERPSVSQAVIALVNSSRRSSSVSALSTNAPRASAMETPSGASSRLTISCAALTVVLYELTNEARENVCDNCSAVILVTSSLPMRVSGISEISISVGSIASGVGIPRISRSESSENDDENNELKEESVSTEG